MIFGFAYGARELLLPVILGGFAGYLFRPLIRLRLNDRVMPRCTFTDPEVASVGLTTFEARSRNVAHDVTRYDLADLDRAIVDRTTNGFVQILTPPDDDTILGVTIVATHAGEMLAEWALAMQHRLGAKKILRTVHAYPTHSEANKAVAATWAKKHTPERALRWLERLHRLRRG